MLLVGAAALGRAEPSREQSRWQAALRLLVVLGDAPYALYLVHPFALRAGREALLAAGLAPALGPCKGILAMFAGAILTSIIVHRLIERPLTRSARALLDPAKPERRSATGVSSETMKGKEERVSSRVERI